MTNNSESGQDEINSAVKPKKKAGYLFPLILAVFCVLTLIIVLSLSSMNNLGKVVVQSTASATLGVGVSITELKVDPKTSSFDIKGLNIYNPPGYTQPYAITVDNISVKSKSITQGFLEFDLIKVEGTHINLEILQEGTNLTDIKHNINSEASQEIVKPQLEPTKVVVNEILIHDAQLTFLSRPEGAEQPVATLPDIALRGIGQKQGGVLASEAIAEIIGHVLTVSIKSAGRSGLFKSMSAAGKDDVKRALGKGGRASVNVKAGIKKAPEAINNLVED